ncbi:efflux RND transporter permease subunit [Ferrimonas marina]|uniref:Multidrug efflux pump n=1 Tax=Ferrimonas marina TaxID=299255 RepID=A0A1M5RC62_9GAMM|nr:efflux RND transporter permease subunit [Ferrimonas marina]SHH23393.1 multidrug efflux pump [Ferrimonas marina]
MLLTDVSVKRPVFASVLSLLLIAFGLVAFGKLPLREYPNIDSPVINISVGYRGASAAVVDSRITQLIESRVSGIEGIRNITAFSRDGRASVNIEFSSSRDIDVAANDVRDKVSRIGLPQEADQPRVTKAEGNSEVIMWVNLTSDRMGNLELTDYANRYLLDRFAVVDGVAEVHIAGARSYAVRVWIDNEKLAARGLTVTDIENALRSENVELPAGSLESKSMQYSLRVQRSYRSAEDFGRMVIGNGRDGYLVRLSDVARVELTADEDRRTFRTNGQDMIGLGITRQSTASTLDVATDVHHTIEQINRTLPDGMALSPDYDTSVFIQASIDEVYSTLLVTMALVVLVIYLFLGSVRAVLIPAITVPVSLIASFMVLYALGYTINLITLLAMILAIGMVVDDAIVMLENIQRRVEEGEPPLKAAFLGARQVGFAIVATTLVLVAVFLPIGFMDGDLGRLFREFSVAMCAAVIFSSLIALTLSPMMASKVLKANSHTPWIVVKVDGALDKLKVRYRALLKVWSKHPGLVMGLVGFAIVGSAYFANKLPSEFAPREDRGSIHVGFHGPQGATYEYMRPYVDEIEHRLMPYIESGEAISLSMRSPRGWGRVQDFNNGVAIMRLADWSERRNAFDIVDELREEFRDLAGVRVGAGTPQPFGRGVGSPVQFVIGGGSYEELAQWRDLILEEAENNPGLRNLDHDYHETKAQLRVVIDQERANDLGVSVRDIGRTLETMLGSRVVTTMEQRGEDYDIILEGLRERQNTAEDLASIYVRSNRTRALIPLSNLVQVEEFADANRLNRHKRMRAVTITANLNDGYSLGEALDYLNGLVKDLLPSDAMISYKGPSQDHFESGSSVVFVFALALLVVFLVLAGQFESYVHPFVIMLTVPLAAFGALVGLYFTDQSINLYSQIGMIMLIGLAAKNGILIVEFANQLRDQGVAFDDAIVEAALARLRPIIMTGITTAAGAIPLVMASGAGAETRFVIGVVVLFGVVIATLFTLLVIPVVYHMLAKRTNSPEFVTRILEQQLADPEHRKAA